MKMNLKVFLIIVFFVNILQGIYTPVIDDEAYYWMWSLNLDFGYFDHPPLIALWIKLSNLLFEQEIGARFFTILFNTITALLFWKLVEPKTKSAIKLFCVTYFSLIFVQIFSFISTPDAPLLFFTVLYLYVLKKYLLQSNYFWTILLGISFAGIMYSKYHGVLVLVFTLLPILNKIYKKGTFYLAIFISLILYSPHFYWLYQHDFPPISYHFIDRSAEEKFDITRTLIYVVTAIGCSLGLLSIYLGKALYKFKPTSSFEKSLWWLAIGPFFFFLFASFKDSVQAQWLAISYIACGLLFYIYFSGKSDLKLLMKIGVINVSILIAGRILVIIPALSPFYETKDFGKSFNELEGDVVAFEKYQEASVFQFYNRDHIGVVYRTLGNRNSQFTMWNDEKLLEEPFIFATKWIHSNDSVVNKKGTYYLQPIKSYTPIHEVNASFLKINNKLIEGSSIDDVINSSSTFTLQFSNIDLDLLRSKGYELKLLLTKDKQYNIIKDIPITMGDLESVEGNDSVYQFNKEIIFDLEEGEYIAYIGITPPELITKYLSKPLKINLSE